MENSYLLKKKMMTMIMIMRMTVAAKQLYRVSTKSSWNQIRIPYLLKKIMTMIAMTANQLYQISIKLSNKTAMIIKTTRMRMATN